MAESDDGRRIGLPGRVYARLSAEVNAIEQKGQHFKVNEAKLAAAILELFLDQHLENDRVQLERLFFDKRSYLKALIDQSASDDDLSSSIHEYLQLSKPRRKPKANEPDVNG